MIDRPSVREIERLKRDLRITHRLQGLSLGIFTGLLLVELGTYFATGHIPMAFVPVVAVLAVAYGLLLLRDFAVRRQIASLK